MKKICCIIGCREIPADKLDYVRRELEREVTEALTDGYRAFIAEFLPGSGMLLASYLDGQREKYPDIFLEVVLVNEKYSREELNLLYKCSSARMLCIDCQDKYPLSVIRNFVEQSSRVIVINVAGDNGTLYAIDYARTMGRDLRIIKI